MNKVLENRHYVLDPKNEEANREVHRIALKIYKTKSTLTQEEVTSALKNIIRFVFFNDFFVCEYEGELNHNSTPITLSELRELARGGEGMTLVEQLEKAYEKLHAEGKIKNLYIAFGFALALEELKFLINQQP